jgi:predicted transcriptional regulator
MSATTTVRVPVALQREVTRVSELVQETPGELLAAAWAEYVERHRDDIAADLKRAADLVRNGTLEDLVDFAQDAHHTVVHVDLDDVIAAWEDPAVQAVLDASRAAVSASRTAGRRIEL